MKSEDESNVNPLENIQGTEEFNNIVNKYKKTINYILKQKVRGNKQIENQIVVLKKDMAEPINRIMSWVGVVTPLIDHIENQMVTEIELLKEYNEYIKEVVAFEKQHLEVSNFIELSHQKITSLSNQLFSLEEKHIALKNNPESVVKATEELSPVEPVANIGGGDVCDTCKKSFDDCTCYDDEDEVCSEEEPIVSSIDVVEEKLPKNEEDKKTIEARKIFEEAINQNSELKFPNKINGELEIDEEDIKPIRRKMGYQNPKT